MPPLFCLLSLYMLDCAVSENAMAELGRLLIYEASRDWLVCLLTTSNFNNISCIVFFLFLS